MPLIGEQQESSDQWTGVMASQCAVGVEHNSRRQLSLGAVGIVVFALSVTVLNQRGLVVADARVEHIVNPQQFLRRHLAIWDDSRGAGTSAMYFSPVISALQSGLQFLGVTAWLIGRLTLGLYLSVAGIGAMLLAYRLDVRPAWVAVLAGWLFAFSTFSSQFLLPSSLFVPAALLPWLILIVLAALDGRDLWRYAALVALLVFVVGLLNTASLVYSLLPVAVFAVLLVALERVGSWRVLVGFAARVLVLVVPISAAMLVVLFASLDTVYRNLVTTESPVVVASASTASETWRGLGHWLSYLTFGSRPKANSHHFFTSVPVVILTFVPVAAAVIGIASQRLRHWRVWLLLMATMVFIFVGANQMAFTPFSSALDELFERSLSARAFRNTNKAGPVLFLSLALFSAVGVREIIDRVRGIGLRGSQVLASPVAVVVTGLVISSGTLAFAAGWVFNPNDTFEEIPGYVEEFYEYMEDFGDDRIVIVPGSSRYRYEWGYVNDSLFDALLAPQAVYSQVVPVSSLSHHRAVEEFDILLRSGQLRPEMVAPILTHLGAQWLLVQNDVQNLDIVHRDVLMDAPGLVAERSFGPETDGVPALELFYVSSSPRAGALWTTDPPVIVSGGEGALHNLSAAGFLRRPVVNLSTLSDDDLSGLLASGSPVVVVDGSQRRAIRMSLERSESVLLSPQYRPYRSVLTSRPFDVDTQTTMRLNNITVESITDNVDQDIWSIGGHAALMFDGNSQSGWSMSQILTPATGRAVHIAFDEPTPLDSIVILTDPDDVTRVETVAVEVTGVSGDQSTFFVDLADEGLTEIHLGGDGPIASVELAIERVSASSGAVRINEVQFFTPLGILDTAPVVSVPTEINRLDPSAPSAISYSFRHLGWFEEFDMIRRFETIRPQVFDLRGTMLNLGGVVADADGCAPVVRIGETIHSVRPAEGGSWFDFELQVEGCQQVELNGGTHQLTELTNNSAALSALVLVDVDLNEQPVALEQVEQDRVGAGLFHVDVPEGPGYLSTSIPYDHRWNGAIEGRSAKVVDGFGRSLWVVSDGPAQTLTIEFSLRVVYLVALVVSSVTVMVCLWLAVARRRR